MFGILIAILSGMLMSIQGVFNTEVTKQTNIWLSSHLYNLCFCFMFYSLVLVGRQASFTSLFKIDKSICYWLEY